MQTLFSNGDQFQRLSETKLSVQQMARSPHRVSIYTLHPPDVTACSKPHQDGSKNLHRMFEDGEGRKESALLGPGAGKSLIPDVIAYLNCYDYAPQLFAVHT